MAQGSRIYAGLDIGTTKISCIIADLGPTGELRIVGVGNAPSDGLRRGASREREQQDERESIEHARFRSSVQNGLGLPIVLRRRDPLPPRKRYSWEDEPDLEPAGDAEIELPRAQEVPVLWHRNPDAGSGARVVELRPREVHADPSRPTLH